MMRPLLAALLLGLTGCQQLAYVDRPHLNMENTVSPIIDNLLRDACGYEDVQADGKWAHSAVLIYKREIAWNNGGGCIDKIGNVYYARCYDWDFDWDTEQYSYRIIRDVPLGSYSCIPERDVEIPYYHKDFQHRSVGEQWTK